MTRRTNARTAGAAFLLYIALGIGAMMLSGRATAGEGIAEKLASMAAHGSDMHASVLLNLFASFCALVLGVTLYALTREQDRDIAMLGLVFRVGEGVCGGISVHRLLGLLWLATATGANVPDPASTNAIGAFLFLGQKWSPVICAIFFAVGSLLFSWLLLRGRMIPALLAWLGVLSSALLVVALPLQLGGILTGAITGYIWIPMAAFEIPFALWLLIKGVAAPPALRSGTGPSLSGAM